MKSKRTMKRVKMSKSYAGKMLKKYHKSSAGKALRKC